MDTNFRISAMLAVAAFAFYSCSSTTSLYSGFSKNKASLRYLYTSSPKTILQEPAIVLLKPVITDPKFMKAGAVRKIGSSVIPLMVYNQWKGTYDYRIGESVISENVSDFVQQNLIEESRRSGNFAVDTTTTPSPDQVTLSIEIDSLGAHGPYIDQGYLFFALFFYSYSFTESAGPGVGYSRFHYKLMRGNDVLHEDFVSSRKFSEPLVNRHRSTKQLRTFYNANLVEAMSLTFKENIAAIVHRINTLIE